MKRLFKIFFIVAVGISLWGCDRAKKDRPLTSVTLKLVWKHQSQFAGFYAADKLGFYREEGLEVKFIPRSSPTENIFQSVMEGTADFGICYGVGIITARSEGLKVKAIASVYRRWPVVFLTRKDSGISRPHDFPGRTIRTPTPGGAICLRAMMKRLNLDPTSVRAVDVGFDFSRFLSGEVDIWPGYITNEVLVARKKGIELNRILPHDYGVHLYGDTLYTMDQTIHERPDVVRAFVRASLRGWRWAIENPSEAGPMARDHEPKLDGDHQIDMLQSGIPFIHTGEDRIGWMREESWQGMHRVLLEQGILKAPVEPKSTFTMEFLVKP